MKKQLLNLTMLLFCMMVSIGSAWADTYQWEKASGIWSQNGGDVTIRNVKWTYSSATYCSITSGKLQVGSSKNPQTNDWTISTPVSNFGTVKSVTINAYTTATTATYDISVGGTSVKSGNLTTSAANYTASGLNATSDDIVITLKGSNNSKAMYLSNIIVEYTSNSVTPPAETGYSYTIGTSTNGTFSVKNGDADVKPGDKVEEGTELTITPIPNDGYKVVSFNIYDGEDHEYIGADPTTKTIESNWVISGVFEKDNSGEVEPTDPDQPDTPTGNVLFYESFNNNNGTGGNDGKWSGSIASNIFKYDNDGWEVVKGSGADKCAKFGTGSAQGSAKTPSINFGTATSAILTFKAAAWNTSTESTTLKISADNAILSVSDVILEKGAWSDYTVYITITNVTGDVKIKFEATQASNNRFFLDEVKIVGEPSVEPEPTIPTSIPFKVSDNDGYWATFSCSEDVTIPVKYGEDKCITTVYTVVAENGKIMLIESENSNRNEWYLSKNIGYLINCITTLDEIIPCPITKGDAATFEYVEPVSDDFNMLKPAANEMKETDCKFYKLTYDATHPLGFYYGATDGAAFPMKNANGAYLAVPNSIAVKSFTLADLSTAIKNVSNTLNSNSPIYNIAGQRVSANTKGILIQNGKKFFNK